MALTADSHLQGGMHESQTEWGLNIVSFMYIRKKKIRLTNPFVMRLVDVLVDERNMQPSMYPVDTIICEQKIPERKT